MDLNHLKTCVTIVPSSYVNLAQQSWMSRNHIFQHLLNHKKIPDEGWNECLVETFLSELSQLDSNNLIGKCGAGEREGRIYSDIVARRNYRFSHGVGRSGDVTAVQPKAAGSSIVNQLCSKLVLDFIHQAGGTTAKSCIIVPMATGMTLLLCFLALKSIRPDARYIIWPRVDQKSCFKSMISAGFEPIVIENCLVGDELCTDVDAIEKVIEKVGADSILCIHTTTSCFAPRIPDKLEEIAQICKDKEIPHIVNNAYGVQLSKCMHLLNQASKFGRVDAFVQSCDKNFMVPVGGSVVASSNKDNFLELVASTYAGRASAAPAIDMLITMLQMGRNGLKNLLSERKDNYSYLREEMRKLAEKHDERILETPHNPISIGMSLSSLVDKTSDVTELGSMLFTRRITGARVVPLGAKKTIGSFSFQGYGSHCNTYTCPYLTVAAAIGMKREECDILVKKLDKTIICLKKRVSQSGSAEISEEC
ncbi:unnamed protein product [Clavelina lepadiformis]|uniref:O-phosphoseryl-tRNA(Sec) selenium transferase n=1 Tax=Clavelina lepadiformis TaxID=159417 RepID=A0ABP0GME8_CLALP